MSICFDLCDKETGKRLKSSMKHIVPSINKCTEGQEELTITITSNYSNIIQNKLSEAVKENGGGYVCSYVEYMSELSGEESVPILEKVISKLKDDVTDDYFEATEGNVKKVLEVLLEFSRIRPDGVWHIY